VNFGKIRNHQIPCISYPLESKTVRALNKEADCPSIEQSAYSIC